METDHSPTPRPGELVVIERPDGQRQVAMVVRAVPPAIEVALIHTEAEWATDADLLVLGPLPYPTWVAADTVSSVLPRRCARRLGRLPPALGARVSAALTTGDLRLAGDLPRGLPLLGHGDPRYAERERFAAWLLPLAAEVIAELEAR